MQNRIDYLGVGTRTCHLLESTFHDSIAETSWDFSSVPLATRGLGVD